MQLEIFDEHEEVVADLDDILEPVGAKDARALPTAESKALPSVFPCTAATLARGGIPALP